MLEAALASLAGWGEIFEIYLEFFAAVLGKHFFRRDFFFVFFLGGELVFFLNTSKKKKNMGIIFWMFFFVGDFLRTFYNTVFKIESLKRVFSTGDTRVIPLEVLIGLHT